MQIMCGLYGFSLVGNKVSADRVVRLTTALAVLNQDRGDQSWGASRCHGSRLVGLGGAANGVGRLIGYALDGARRDDGVIRLMGHTRLATQGKVNKDNCHPFVGKHFTLAHNGQVYGVDHRVDSMALLEKLDGGESFEGLRGYGIATWWSAERPGWLTIARLSAGGDISVASGAWGSAWSSDKDHLDAALRAAGLAHRSKRWLVDTGEAIELLGSGVYKSVKHAGEKRYELVPMYGLREDSWRSGYASSVPDGWTLAGGGDSAKLSDDDKKVITSIVERDGMRITTEAGGVTRYTPIGKGPDVEVITHSAEGSKPTEGEGKDPDLTPPTGRRGVTPFMLRTIADAYKLTPGDLAGMNDQDLRDAFFDIASAGAE